MTEKGVYEALRDFANVARRLGFPFLLVGAGARLMIHDWKNKCDDMRHTDDWDFGVQLQSWDAFQLLRDELVSTGLFLDCGLRHRLRHGSGIMVDFVPFGGVEASDGMLAWPGEDRIMNVVGFREALAHAVHEDIGEGMTLPVVGLPGFLILKLFAFLDRRGMEREKDLQDLYFVLKRYHEGDGGTRCFEELGERLACEEVAWENAGACLAGIDVANIVAPETYRLMTPILDELCDAQALRLEPLVRGRRLFGEDEELARRQEIRALFTTFRDTLVARYAFLLQGEAPGA